MKRVSALVLVALLALPASGQSFEQDLAAALGKGDTTSVTELIEGNRLQVKPFFDRILGEALVASRDGDGELAERMQAQAWIVARRFETAFGESSLSKALGLVAEWTSEERATKLRADSLEARGTALRASRDTRPEAMTLFREALDLYQSIGDVRGIAQAEGGIGYLQWFLDRDLYLEQNLRALDARYQADDQQLIGNTLYDVGLAYQYVERNAEKAVSFYRRSDSVRVAIGDSLALNRMLPAVASLYRTMGDLPTARRYYDRAIAAHERAGDESRLAVSERNQGVLLSEMGFHSDALAHLNRARSIYDRAGNTADVAPVISWIGVVHRRLGDYDAAVEAYQRAIEIAREVDNAEWLADAYNNLGVVLAYADRYDRAATYYRRALEQFQSIESARGTLDATLNIADSYFELEDYEQAEAFGRDALAQADSVGDPIRQSRALGTLAGVFARSGRVQESNDTFDRLLVMAHSMSMPEMVAGALIQRAEFEVERGEAESAIRNYQLAFETLERTRGAQDTDEDRAGYLAQQRYAYEDFTHFLARQYATDPDGPYLDLAFEYAERGKARSFLELLAEALADVQQGIDPELRERQSLLMAAIANARQAASAGGDKSELESLEASYDQLKRDIRVSNPRYADLQYPSPARLSDVQKDLLDEDTVLLEYAVGDSSTTLIAVTQDGASLFTLPGRAAIQERVELLRFALTNPEQVEADAYGSSAHALYQMLIEPARDLTGRVSRLVVVPDGVLHYIPFEALVTDSISGVGFGELPYLVDTHVVSYAPSASVLLQLHGAPNTEVQDSRRALLAVGDPVFSPESRLARLPYSGAEVSAIADMFDAGQADVLMTESASESSVKIALGKQGYRYVHFATHGIVNEDRPDFSGIAFALGGSTDDGFLQAAEIFDLRIDADMVVLSACETGLGQMVRGEGLVGLTRAFMYAGTPSVVVSLWSVADESTSSLMQLFYAGLASGDGSRDAALTQAKRRMIADGVFSHPFQWAPFVLVGDPGP